MAISEIILPKVFQEIAFSSIAEQVSSININLPGKVFAVPEYGIEINSTRAGQLYSHWQAGIDDGAPYSKRWDFLRWYPGESAEQVVSRVPDDSSYVLMSQVLEDRGFHGYQTGNFELLDDIFDKAFAKTGQSDPANTNLVRDYFDQDGIGQIALDALKAAPGSAFWTNWKQRFTSESEARKTRDGTLSSFFARGAKAPVNNGNWMVGGYLDGWHRVPEHMHVYMLWAEIEQKHLAVRRKTIQFSWDLLEGAEWKIYKAGSFQQIRFENPAGYIYKSTLNGVPPEMMYRQGLINSLLGEGMIHWGTAGRSTQDINRWIRSYNGGFNASKTKWKKDGSNLVVDYNPNDPTMPAKSPGDNPLNYTGPNVQIIPPTFGGPTPNGVHDSLAGRWVAAQVFGRSTGMRWPQGATYKINGGSPINVYPGGPNPRNGVLTNATLSTLNNRNFGQDNIVWQCEHKRPIFAVSGTPGNGFIWWCNPVADIDEVNEVTFTESGSHTFTAIGPNMRMFNW